MKGNIMIQVMILTVITAVLMLFPGCKKQDEP